MNIFPSVGFIKPIRISIKVLLPDPVLPIIATLSPFEITKEILFRMFLLGKFE